ncbi:MAG: methyltransferase domain-containing protein [Deltaproteobacteria bacterium]|nr:methyltransferase domain-containing protein [Deltaproteobacteria bacterium]
MRAKCEQLFVCPACNNAGLSVRRKEDAAYLLCNECETKVPVVNGIPRFVPSNNYANSFGFQWNIHRNTQLDSRTGLSLSRDRLFGVTCWPDNLEGEVILEAGSGAGRFTEVLLSTGAEVVSFDYSAAVEANMLNNGRYQNLCLFQGDIYQIPLTKASFDKVVCLGVLQHTPDPAAAFASLARYVKPGGMLVIDVYRNNLASLLHWKYVLRPLTKRMNQQALYRIIENTVPSLVPLSAFLRRTLGRAGMRLIPILQFEHWGLSPAANREWAILDTFDMYSPAHDHPQSIRTVKRWFIKEGFEQIDVRPGPNGVVGRARKPPIVKERGSSL